MIKQPNPYQFPGGIQLNFPGAPYASSVFTGNSGNLNFTGNINLTSAGYPHPSQDNPAVESLGLRYRADLDQLQIVYLPAGQPYTALQVTAYIQGSTGVFVPGSYTVAQLNAMTSIPNGARATCIDANAPTFLGVLVGGGTVECPAFYNNTAWVSG